MSESKAPFTIGPNRRAVLQLSTLISILVGVAYATWFTRDYIDGIKQSILGLKDEIKQLRLEIERQNGRFWLAEEQFRWAGQLRWEFRKSEFTIPEPRDFRSTP